jgi:hypothetical protein
VGYSLVELARVKRNYEIDMSMRLPKKKATSSNEQTDWPVMPLEDDEEESVMLRFLFYDGSTETDEEEASGYSRQPFYTMEISQTINASTSISSKNYTLAFHQTGYEIDVDALEAAWTEKEDQPSVFETRMPLLLLTEDDLTLTQDEEDKIIPVGYRQPNMEIQILDYYGTVIDEVDLVQIFGEGSDVQLAEYTDEDETAVAGYSWFTLPSTAFHLKVKEKTSRSVFTQIQVHPYPPETDDIHTHVTTIEGLFWHWFDTSDVDNFKMTEEPRYDSEEVTGEAIVLTDPYSTIQIFLFPRRWWSYQRFGTPLNRNMFGIWDYPPLDFVMPMQSSRREWTLSTPWALYPGEGETPYFTEEEAYIKHETGNDTLNYNNLHILHVWPSWGSFPPTVILSESAPVYDARFMFYQTFGEGDVASEINYFYGPDVHAFGCYISGVFQDPNPYVDGGGLFGLWWVITRNGWFGHVADGKGPGMFHTKVLGPGDAGIPEVDWSATREHHIYNPLDYDTNDVNQITVVRDHFRNHSVVPTGVKSSVPLAWAVTLGQGIEGDLVGVIKTEDRNLFIWRRVDEQIELTGSGMLNALGWSNEYVNGNHYVQGSELSSVGKVYDTELINNVGHLDVQFTELLDSGYYTAARKMRTWGTYFKSSAPRTFIRGPIDIGLDSYLILYDQGKGMSY